MNLNNKIDSLLIKPTSSLLIGEEHLLVLGAN